MTRSLAKARERTTKRLASCELPDVWVQGTVASAANAYSRKTKSAKASRRRLNDKVERLQAEPRYRMQDDPATGADTSFTLASFAEANAEDLSLDNYLRELRSLSVGGSMWFGGGAAPVVTIVRVS